MTSLSGENCPVSFSAMHFVSASRTCNFADLSMRKIDLQVNMLWQLQTKMPWLHTTPYHLYSEAFNNPSSVGIKAVDSSGSSSSSKTSLP